MIKIQKKQEINNKNTILFDRIISCRKMLCSTLDFQVNPIIKQHNIKLTTCLNNPPIEFFSILSVFKIGIIVDSNGFLY